ncbi:farnesyl-diphosphate synthase [Methylobacterium nodulans ORS 2060]|uniref:Farnesyl-diphosphate synthase n=1 Tax=Methylobacterium nodulans (strain LMG 21967 / CNCM I-2342 / ORS 2060) TaxID=460265 RepID=B8ILS1_METNO|nr:farnesyl-diphosphate synthase [Methylobacterium nodulans ORS 2060]
MGLAAAKDQCDRLVAEAHQALAAFGVKADMLRATADFVARRDR